MDMLSPISNFTLPRSKSPLALAGDEAVPVQDLQPLAPEGIEKLMVTPDLAGQATSIQMKALFSGEDISLVDFPKPKASEKLIQNIRKPLNTAISATLPLAGAAVFGPVGLAIGVGAGVALSMLKPSAQTPYHRAKVALRDGALTAGLGAIGLIPGAIGGLLSVATGVGLAKLASKVEGKKEDSGVSLRFSTFAENFVPKVEKKTGLRIETGLKATEGSPDKEKLAAQALRSAIQVCCEQLSPAVAVSLARESAKELVKLGGAQEDLIEALLTKDPATEIEGNVRVSSIQTQSPAVATVRHVLLQPKFAREQSSEGIAAAVGHEQSHIDNRDPIGNLGENTLTQVLESDSNNSLNPLRWHSNEKLSNQIKLAGAAISRETEYRCDREGADKMLASGASKEQVQKGFTEIFSIHPGTDEPLAEHPLSVDRIAAVKAHLDSLPD